jgi:hypothetical protein
VGVDVGVGVSVLGVFFCVTLDVGSRRLSHSRVRPVGGGSGVAVSVPRYSSASLWSRVGVVGYSYALGLGSASAWTYRGVAGGGVGVGVSGVGSREWSTRSVRAV